MISLGLWDDTILLYSSDHACHFKTRNAEYKRSCHESSIRVPTALHGRMFEGGGQLRQLVSLIDLPPTLLEAAGLPVPPAMQGHSLVPLLRRQNMDWPEEVFIQVSESEVGRAIRTQRWKYGVVAPDKDPNGDSGAEIYVEEYLYDLVADPYELADLSGLTSHQEVTAILRERLIRRMVAAGEAAPQIRPAPPRPAFQQVVSSAEAYS